MTGKITLLLEHFSGLSSAVEQGRRFGAIESLLSHGRSSNHGFASFDELRFDLFGVSSEGPLPVAALTRLADRPDQSVDACYRLRLDPVTLWADMARIVMTRCGFADLDERERNEIENTIRSVLFQEGFDLESDHPERWTIALEKPLQFGFTPLEQALGMDVAEVLPDHPEALQWRRILNEIQMALHACPTNVRRRQQGRVEINSVWFWGGGFLPQAANKRAFQTIYSSHPITRGLAMMHGCDLHEPVDAKQLDIARHGQNILIDWTPLQTSTAAELSHFERLTVHLIEQAKTNNVSIQLCTDGGKGWLFGPKSMWRWWKRRQPLDSYLSATRG